ncbi:hypothetical protein A7A08_02462 [Methyloligella halotolerans]|uniref:Heme oxygenase n=1 Tax=Methyloligella halotolerans TaxID=1177755 RepID=A0A1E2RWT9_9HYPH|nr:biliverdin-producing heme oxygenase [Methyloligella halotolerans]ODA66694.1 hypothetical protein A7A08_02462 [Methyloligella halotolerans]
MLSRPTLERASARDRLRHATSGMHQAVDDRFAGMLRDRPAGYGRFLAAIADALFPLEEALERAEIGRLWPDWPRHARTGALRADLSALNIPSTPVQPVPELRGEAHQLGLLYVLEGSRLGGTIILRGLRKEFGAAQHPATRYLMHGEGEGLWARYLQRLEASEAVRRAPEEAEAGAMLAFSYFLPAAPHRRHGGSLHEEVAEHSSLENV